MRFSPIFLALILGVLFHPFAAEAQSFTLDMNGISDGLGGGSAAARMIQIILLLTVLAIAPSILVMTTSFIRIVVVLSFMRSALGTQTTPPNQVIISLALFVTLFVFLRPTNIFAKKDTK